MMDMAIVIQARMGSSRLPGKVLMNFCGKPMLIFQVELLRAYKTGLPLIVATSVSSEDDPITSICLEHGIPCYRGSVDDVFSRYREIALNRGLKDIIRLTGDNPLTDHGILQSCIAEHSASGADLTSTRRILPDGTIERYVPKGNSVDVISAKALLGIVPDELTARDREHVIPAFFKGGHKVSFVSSPKNKGFSYSIDDAEDFARVEEYVSGLLKENRLMEEMGYDA